MKKITEQDVEDRMKVFWTEVKGIQKAFNLANPANSFSDYNDKRITHYFLWRILNELKVLNQSQNKVRRMKNGSSGKEQSEMSSK